MNAVDLFFAAAQLGEVLWLLAPGVAAAVCWRALRRAWDRARWAWTARRAAEWARLQPYYADERGNQ